jgi:hypothetical protein
MYAHWVQRQEYSNEKESSNKTFSESSDWIFNLAKNCLYNIDKIMQLFHENMSFLSFFALQGQQHQDEAAAEAIMEIG